jgi:hypothetical protein
MDPDIARKNVRWGLALFAFALLLFAGSVAVAELYNAFAG